MNVESPESVINGRFKVSEKPLVAPGKCACCGAVDRPVVDFGFDVDFYGTILMCGNCLREALGVYEGAFPPAIESQAQVVPLPTITAGDLHDALVTARDAITALDRSIPANFLVSPNQADALRNAWVGGTPFPELSGEPIASDDTHDESTNGTGPDDSSSPVTSSIFD